MIYRYRLPRALSPPHCPESNEENFFISFSLNTVNSKRWSSPPRKNFLSVGYQGSKICITFSDTRENSKRSSKKINPRVWKFSGRGAMFDSLYLHKYTSSYNIGYIILFASGYPTMFWLKTTITNATYTIKSDKAGFVAFIDFEFSYFFCISAVIPHHEWPFTELDSALRAESCTLFQHISISFLQMFINGYLIFP